MTDSADSRELELTRFIAAPPALVYRAWTDPALLLQWFTPAPWKTTKAELDVRAGGSNLIVMEGPEGQVVPNRGVYLEVVPNEPALLLQRAQFLGCPLLTPGPALPSLNVVGGGEVLHHNPACAGCD